MFISFGQISVALFNVCLGALFFIAYKFYRILAKLLHFKILRVLSDVVFFIAFAIFYVYITYKIGFPNFRFYMLFSFFAGAVIYYESFHILLANIGKKLYNKRRKQSLR